MQDIWQEILNECICAEQLASVVLWEIDLIEVGMDVALVSFVRKVRFGDGYFQRALAGLNANLKMYSVMLFVFCEEAMVLELFLEEHGGWKFFLWMLLYEWRQIKVICAKWLLRVSMLRVEFSAEFEQVVN